MCAHRTRQASGLLREPLRVGSSLLLRGRDSPTGTSYGFKGSGVHRKQFKDPHPVSPPPPKHREQGTGLWVTDGESVSTGQEGDDPMSPNREESLGGPGAGRVLPLGALGWLLASLGQDPSPWTLLSGDWRRGQGVGDGLLWLYHAASRPGGRHGRRRAPRQFLPSLRLATPGSKPARTRLCPAVTPLGSGVTSLSSVSVFPSA